MYTNVGRWAPHNPLIIRAMSSGVAWGSSLMTLITRISTVVETIFKSLCNMVISPFKGVDRFLVGVNQLFIKLPQDITKLICSPIEFVVGALITQGALLITPQKFAERRAYVHRTNVDDCKRAFDRYNKGFTTNLSPTTTPLADYDLLKKCEFLIGKPGTQVPDFKQEPDHLEKNMNSYF